MATDQAPYQGSSSATNLARDYSWGSAGAKTVLVLASNAVGGVSGSWPVDVRDLCLDACEFYRVTPVSNRVTLTITGTSSQSTYRVDCRTNLTAGAWQVAAPAGAAVPGCDGAVTWTDGGASNRNLSACQALYYRVVLDE